MISILLAVLLFGLFWLWQRSALESGSAIVPIARPEAIVDRSAKNDPADFSSLEASAVNTPIPDFSSAL